MGKIHGNEQMISKFNVIKHVRTLRHLDSMTLVSYRDALRDANLSVTKPRSFGNEDEKMLIDPNTTRLVRIINTARVKDGVYMMDSAQECAMDHHIAVNFILRERGFTSAIDDSEFTIDLT